MDRYELVDFLEDYIQNRLDDDKSNVITEQVVIIVSSGFMAEQLGRPIYGMLKELESTNKLVEVIFRGNSFEVINRKSENFFNMNIAVGRPDEFFLTGRRPKTVLVYGTNFTAEQMGRIFDFILMHERKGYCVRFFNR